MSVGTIVTIVLLMTVLILGLVLVRTIFTGSVDAIKGINQGIKAEIQKIFNQDNLKKMVVYPDVPVMTIKKGSDDFGFGFAIRNLNEESSSFSYDISATDTSCPNSMRLDAADKLISVRKEGNNIEIPASSIMENPIFVPFNIPETAPACTIGYTLQVYEGSRSNPYTSAFINLKIQSS